jgi:hypothetical protein
MGMGPGAEERGAAALVIIFGQSLTLLVTLVGTPLAYFLLDRLKSGVGYAWQTSKRAVTPASHPSRRADSIGSRSAR